MSNPGEIVEKPTDNDILCGRGKALGKHPGNVQFIDLIRTHLPQYVASKNRNEKTLLIASIVKQIQQAPYSARFLKKQIHPTNKSKSYYKVQSQEEARTKTGHAIRDLLRHKDKKTTRQKGRLLKSNKKKKQQEAADLENATALAMEDAMNQRKPDFRNYSSTQFVSTTTPCAAPMADSMFSLGPSLTKTNVDVATRAGGAAVAAAESYPPLPSASPNSLELQLFNDLDAESLLQSLDAAVRSGCHHSQNGVGGQPMIQQDSHYQPLRLSCRIPTGNIMDNMMTLGGGEKQQVQQQQGDNNAFAPSGARLPSIPKMPQRKSQRSIFLQICNDLASSSEDDDDSDKDKEEEQPEKRLPPRKRRFSSRLAEKQHPQEEGLGVLPTSAKRESAVAQKRRKSFLLEIFNPEELLQAKTIFSNGSCDVHHQSAPSFDNNGVNSAPPPPTTTTTGDFNPEALLQANMIPSNAFDGGAPPDHLLLPAGSANSAAASAMHNTGNWMSDWLKKNKRNSGGRGIGIGGKQRRGSLRISCLSVGNNRRTTTGTDGTALNKCSMAADAAAAAAAVELEESKLGIDHNEDATESKTSSSKSGDEETQMPLPPKGGNVGFSSSSAMTRTVPVSNPGAELPNEVQPSCSAAVATSQQRRSSSRLSSMLSSFASFEKHKKRRSIILSRRSPTLSSSRGGSNLSSILLDNFDVDELINAYQNVYGIVTTEDNKKDDGENDDDKDDGSSPRDQTQKPPVIACRIPTDEYEMLLNEVFPVGV